MTDITIFPDRLTAMTEADLAALPAEQLREIHFNLAQLIEWVKKAQAKTHNAMKRRYAEQERAVRSCSAYRRFIALWVLACAFLTHSTSCARLK